MAEAPKLKLKAYVALYQQVKCHQYWPNPDSTATYGHFQVACLTEEGNSAFLVRDMTLTHFEVTVCSQVIVFSQ